MKFEIVFRNVCQNLKLFLEKTGDETSRDTLPLTGYYIQNPKCESQDRRKYIHSFKIV